MFAVLFALIAYASGVKTQDSVAAVLSAELAAELSAELAAGVETELTSLGEKLTGGPKLACEPLGTALVGEIVSYPKSDGFSTYCLTLDDDSCWDAGFKYHFKGTTPKGRPFCPRPAHWNGVPLAKFNKELHDAKGETLTPTKYDKVIVKK